MLCPFVHKKVFLRNGSHKKMALFPSEPSAIVLSNLAPLPCLYFTWLQPSECNKEKHSVFKEKVDAKMTRICHHKMSDISKAALLN